MKHLNSDKALIYRKIVGQVVHEFRCKKKISQRLLADEYGIQRSLLARIELGESDFHISSILSICEALGIKQSTLDLEVEKRLPEDFTLMDW